MTVLESRLREQWAEDVPPQRIDAVWQGLSRRRSARKDLSSRPLVLFAAAAVAAAIALVLAFGSATTAAGSGPLRLATGGVPPALSVGAPGALTVLADGSRIETARATELAPTQNDGSHFGLRLARGRATFDVVPGGPRAWIIDAGSVKVTVLGTKFTVDRSDQRVRVDVERGHVRVTTPAGERELKAGESLEIPLSTPRLLRRLLQPSSVGLSRLLRPNPPAHSRLLRPNPLDRGLLPFPRTHGRRRPRRHWARHGRPWRRPGSSTKRSTPLEMTDSVRRPGEADPPTSCSRWQMSRACPVTPATHASPSSVCSVTTIRRARLRSRPSRSGRSRPTSWAMHHVRPTPSRTLCGSACRRLSSRRPGLAWRRRAEGRAILRALRLQPVAISRPTRAAGTKQP